MTSDINKLLSLKNDTAKVISQLDTSLTQVTSKEYIDFIKKLGGDISSISSMLHNIFNNINVIKANIIDDIPPNDSNSEKIKIKKFSEIFSKLSILQQQMGVAVGYLEKYIKKQADKPSLNEVVNTIVRIWNYTQLLRFEIIFTNGFSISKETIGQFIDANKSLSDIASTKASLNKVREEADKILGEMRLVADAVTREGLTKSYRSAVKELSLKVRGFDILNYLSLLMIFSITVGLFLNIEWVNAIKPENISIYERFVLILPFVFLSWFASKRSQFLYQIKEEYSYKYNTALAYEGYRNEVEKLKDSDEMKKRLIETAIDNLSRSPLEQFDKNSEHAPYAQFIKEFRNK